MVAYPDRESVEKVLKSFVCLENKEVETFLHHKAIEFENLAKSRTYLVCDEHQLDMAQAEIDELTVYGYVSLAVKTLVVNDALSNRKRKELDGFSAKLHGKPLNHFPCYLIGQLARNSNVPKEDVKGSEMIETAYSIIENAEKAVGGRYIMAECENEDGLIRFYEQNEFMKFADVIEDDCHMVQMLRRIQ